MEQEINVKVGAQVTEFNQKMAEAGKTVDTFAKKGGQSLTSFSKGSNQAAFALTNLGRVAQDVPFGFIGIQNNLNPLLESFQQLKKETGSTSLALKAMVSGLMGPAGIGIALSLVSSAILLYTSYTQRSAKATKEAADEMDALAGSASKEIVELTTLYGATQNLNIPLDKRKKIVDELQRQFPTTFGNLTDEAILAGKAAGAYEELTKSILKKAVIQAAQEDLSKQLKPLVADILTAKKGAIEIAQVLPGLEEANKQLLKSGKGVEEGFGRVTAQTVKIKTVTGATAAFNKEMEVLNKTLGFFISSLGSDAIDVNKTKDKLEKIKDYVYDFKVAAEGSVKVLSLENIDTELVGSQLSALNKKVSTQLLSDATKNSKDVLEQQMSAVADFQTSILSSVEHAFDSFFMNILTKGTLTFKSLGQAILGEFARILSSAVTNQLLKIILKVAGGLLGGPAGGFATSALGKFLIPGFAGGVDNFRGGLAMVGERGPELVNLPRGSSVIPNGNFGGVFIATSYTRGSVIETAYNRSLARSRRING